MVRIPSARAGDDEVGRSVDGVDSGEEGGDVLDGAATLTGLAAAALSATNAARRSTPLPLSRSTHRDNLTAFRACGRHQQ